jgi:calmodulin
MLAVGTDSVPEYVCAQADKKGAPPAPAAAKPGAAAAPKPGAAPAAKPVPGSKAPAEKLDPQTKAIRDCFAAFDADKDGKINHKDFAAAFRSLGHAVTAAEVKAMLGEVDKGNKGAVELKDFEALAKRKRDKLQEDALKKAFKSFDKDGNGFVSEVELRHAMTSMGEKFSQEEVDEMVRELKADSDGQINYDEFVGQLLAMAAT